MKLDAAQLLTVENGLGIKSIPDDSPAVTQLADAFGPHTFFLDTVGLCVFENDPSDASKNGLLIRLAKWNKDQTSLEGHEPEAYNTDVNLGAPDA